MKVILRNAITLALVALSTICTSCLRELKEKDLPLREPIGLPASKAKVLITLRSGVAVVKDGDSYIYSGDILLNKEQLERLDQTGSIFTEDSFKPDEAEGVPVNPMTGFITKTRPKDRLKAVGRTSRLGMFWAMVRYTFASNLSEYQKERIREAIKTIERETNARFYDANGKPTRDPVYGFDYPYVEFNYNKEVNNSAVGRIGGKQIINLADYSAQTIIHEICHALGMHHEHCRNDRDEYITVDYSNIVNDEKIRSNFRLIDQNYHRIGHFDFESIMLYGSYIPDISIDPSKPIMKRKDGSTFFGGEKLSEDDKRFINKFYLPYVAREDVCVELDSVMYDANNNRLSAERIAQIQSKLNVGRCQHMVTNPEDMWGMYGW